MACSSALASVLAISGRLLTREVQVPATGTVQSRRLLQVTACELGRFEPNLEISACDFVSGCFAEWYDSRFGLGRGFENFYVEVSWFFGTIRLHWKSGCTDGLECEFVCLRRVLRVIARGAGGFAEEKVNYVDFAFATLFGESFWGQQCLRFPDAWRKCFEKPSRSTHLRRKGCTRQPRRGHR